MIEVDLIEKNLIEESNKKNITRLLVGAVILNDKKDSILLLKRSPNEFMPLLEELPSGKIKKNETFKQALSRELFEETSLKIDKILKYLNYFDYHSQSGKLTRQFNFLITVKNLSPIILSNQEHCAYRWHDINTLNEQVTDSINEIIKLI
jgi:8-oxo-dGTP diphosphatase